MGLGFCASLNRLCKVMFQMVFAQAKLLVFGLFRLLIAGTGSERFFARMGLSVWPGARGTRIGRFAWMGNRHPHADSCT